MSNIILFQEELRETYD